MMRIVFFSIGLCFCNLIFSQSKSILSYNKPAEYFEESLPLGNGKMGASVFGGTNQEKIYLNDITLWAGEPVDSSDINYDAYKYIPQIREALENEKYRKADSLNKFVQGAFSESYAPAGTVFINFENIEEVSNYNRKLDISKAVSNLSFMSNNVRFCREYFISNPDKIFVIKLNSSKKESLNFSVFFESLLKYKTTTSENSLVIKGYAPFHAEPSYRGNMPNAVMFDESKGTRFSSIISIANTDGEVLCTDSNISVKKASFAEIRISLETSFNGFDKNPATEGADDFSIAEKNILNAKNKDYKTLKQAHIADYKSFFDRVDLCLGKTNAPDLATDERLKRYSEGNEDKNLEILYFQFGRYLMISASRTNAVPMNLQGLWNPYLQPPWSSNYTMNINLQENYWGAETGNLPEMHKPLFSFIENLSKTGTETAKYFYNCRGWTSCHNSDIWAMSHPVGDFGKGDPCWANWNMSGPWLCTHLWEHYLFNRNIDFLRDTAFQIMKGSAEFCLDWLISDKDGFLITSPSTSPENLFLTPAGYAAATLYGATADISIIRELFQQFLKAASILNIEDDFTKRVRIAIEKLLPYKISADGHLQEWYHDWADIEPTHRHQSHLFGLFPGHQISIYTTPKLAQACKKTLEIKGNETTGWSMGWRINLWARLGDGNRAYTLLRRLLKYVEPDERVGGFHGGGTYPNLFDAHPPFQIDGNFGGSAAIIEMILQSNTDTVFVLPATPDCWDNGCIKGVRTRTGAEINSLCWNKKNIKIILTPIISGKKTFIWNNNAKTVDFIKNKKQKIIFKKTT